ncbi:hypothetical protein BDR26DRAFT_565558 [Obelidium mucronatum]|nr:hypothetical protein BDR26DRAFT_565558 [Obelidium mucronatum]
MKRDGIVGPDAITEANGGLKIDTYNQLLQLFTTPVRQLDTSKLVEAAQEVERNPNSTSDEIILQPPYIETNVQTTWTDPIKPSQQDLLFAQQELLPCVNTLNTATTTTHVHILTLFAGLQDLKGLISAHEAAFDQIQETISQSEEPIEFCHALLKINAHSIDCFLDAGFAPHAVAVVRSLPNGVIKSTERLFLVEDSPLVGPDGSDGTSSARLGSRGVDMIRKDAKKLLGVCLKALTWAGPSPVKKGEIEEKISLAESLVSSLNGVIGCQWDEFSVSCLVKLYGCVDLSKSEEWAIRGILWFGDDLSSGKGGVRVRTALAQVYAHRSTLVQLKHEWEELREKSLRIVEEREDKVVFGKGMCMALLDALDTLEIVAAEKGFEGTKETDERERAVRRRLG